MRHFLLITGLALMAFGLAAQKSRWQYGLGANTHLTGYSLQAPPAIEQEPLLRYGVGALARYRINRSGKLRWGPWSNRYKLFVETGLQADALGYAYLIDKKPIMHEFLSIQVPLNLVLTAESRNLFSGKRKPQLGGYARLGGGVGITAAQKNDLPAGYAQETLELLPLRFFLHLSSGLAKIRMDGGQSSVGIFSRISLLPLAEGTLATASTTQPLPFRAGGHMIGLECLYLFGNRKPNKPGLPEEPVQMILCPKF